MRGRNRFWVAAVCAACLLAAALLIRGVTGSRGRPPIILISIDTCRADHLGCYGDLRGTTPHLDALAREALLFTNVVAPVPLTLPSHCSIMTGLLPSAHGVRDNKGYRLAADHTTLAELLVGAGYQTAAVIGAFPLDAQFGMAQGFAFYDDRMAARVPPAAAERNERPAAEVTHLAARWLDQRHGDRFFLFVHYYDPHAPYRPPAPFATTFADHPYAGEVAYTDQAIGDLVTKLKQLGLYDKSLILVTADHGEGLGEHGEGGHGFFVYQSTIHVPLLLKLPGSQRAARVAGLAGLIDIAPTILKLVGRAATPEMRGEDLIALAQEPAADAAQRLVFSESLLPTAYGCSPLFAVVGERWKYIEAPRPELYALRSDPAETQNRAAEEASRVDRLRRELLTALTADDAPSEAARAELDDAARERLRSLGYVAGDVSHELPAPDDRMKDPKDLIAYHERFQQALELLDQGGMEKARGICEELLVVDPMIAEPHIILGNIAAAEQRLAAAARHYRDYLAAGAEVTGADLPGGPSRQGRVKAHYNLANILTDLGDDAAAVQHYEQALALDAGHLNAHVNLGLTLDRLGESAAAAEQLFAALRIKPDQPDVHFNLGRILLALDRPAEAERHLMEALRMVPNHPGALKLSGDALRAQEKTAEAMVRYARALDLAATLKDAYLPLAQGHLSLGQGAQAVAVYRRALRAFPDWNAAAQQLAWVLATHEDPNVRDGREATTIARRLCAASGEREAAYLETLAAAHAEESRFDEALAAQQKAIELLRAAGADGPLAVAIERGERYRARQPVRAAFTRQSYGSP